MNFIIDIYYFVMRVVRLIDLTLLIFINISLNHYVICYIFINFSVMLHEGCILIIKIYISYFVIFVHYNYIFKYLIVLVFVIFRLLYFVILLYVSLFIFIYEFFHFDFLCSYFLFITIIIIIYGSVCDICHCLI